MLSVCPLRLSLLLVAVTWRSAVIFSESSTLQGYRRAVKQCGFPSLIKTIVQTRLKCEILSQLKLWVAGQTGFSYFGKMVMCNWLCHVTGHSRVSLFPTHSSMESSLSCCFTNRKNLHQSESGKDSPSFVLFECQSRWIRCNCTLLSHFGHSVCLFLQCLHCNFFCLFVGFEHSYSCLLMFYVSMMYHLPFFYFHFYLWSKLLVNSISLDF